jgi:hypothetical protein
MRGVSDYKRGWEIFISVSTWGAPASIPKRHFVS